MRNNLLHLSAFVWIFMAIQSNGEAAQSVADMDRLNADFAAALQAKIISQANQTATDLQNRSALVRGLVSRLKRTARLSDADNTIVQFTFGEAIARQASAKPALVAAKMSTIAKTAAKLAHQVQKQASEFEFTSPDQTLHYLGSGLAASEIAEVFPDRQFGATADIATRLPSAAQQPNLNFFDLQAMAGQWANFGGPTIQYDEVALLLWWDSSKGDFEPRCTATLVGPHTLITAAHCFCPPPTPPETGNASKAKCDADAQNPSLNPVSNKNLYRVFLQRAGIFPLRDYRINPAYAFGTNAVGLGEDKGDVAVASISQDVQGIPFAARVSQPVANAGMTTTMVGYGAGFSPELPPDPSGVNQPGLKLWVPVVLSNCTTPFDSAANYCWSSGPADPSKSGAMCPGDSGGPLFLPTATQTSNATDRIIGVNSADLLADGQLCNTQMNQGDTNIQADLNSNFLASEVADAAVVPDYSVTLLHVPLDFIRQQYANWQGSFPIREPLTSVVISVDGYTRSQLQLLVTDSMNKVSCSYEGGAPQGLPSVDACKIVAPPQNDQITVTVTGLPLGLVQVLATGYRVP